MLKIVAASGAIVAVAIVVVLIAAAMKPDVFRVQRTAAIKAPPEKIFPYVNDLRKFAEWSPFERKDPDMKRSYSATTSGKGASYQWDGNSQVGSGAIEIEDAATPARVTMNLTMLRPFEVHNVVDFTLVPAGDSTTVTWAMRGGVPYFAKIIHVFINMDRMVGGDFETGLAKLKAIVEH